MGGTFTDVVGWTPAGRLHAEKVPTTPSRPAEGVQRGLARLTAHLGRDDERMRGWLEEISLRSHDEPWRHWARAHLASLDTDAH